MLSPDLSGAEFRTSTLSGPNNDCVEVATNLPGLVAIRDSKDRNGPALTFSPTAWSNLLTGIRNGEI
ncbi:DUF397 domain-containing protein [Streptosporangium sp. NPDC023615]|uniref:DUF397 domain-containing protein n=1 Tax=Streptosporangium sp. NPDC023615 TaxID=3154794 RepID=UPI00341537B2